MTMDHRGHAPGCLVATSTGQCTCNLYAAPLPAQTLTVNGVSLKPCPGQCGGAIEAKRSYCPDCFEGALILNRAAVERARAALSHADDRARAMVDELEKARAVCAAAEIVRPLHSDENDEAWDAFYAAIDAWRDAVPVTDTGTGGK